MSSASLASLTAGREWSRSFRRPSTRVGRGQNLPESDGREHERGEGHSDDQPSASGRKRDRDQHDHEHDSDASPHFPGLPVRRGGKRVIVRRGPGLGPPAGPAMSRYRMTWTRAAGRSPRGSGPDKMSPLAADRRFRSRSRREADDSAAAQLAVGLDRGDRGSGRSTKAGRMHRRCASFSFPPQEDLLRTLTAQPRCVLPAHGFLGRRRVEPLRIWRLAPPPRFAEGGPGSERGPGEAAQGPLGLPLLPAGQGGLGSPSRA